MLKLLTFLIKLMTFFISIYLIAIIAVQRLKLLTFMISIFLIASISARVPQENIGLSSFATKRDLLGSPISVQRFLNIGTAIGILIYFGIAIQMNLGNH